MPERTDTDVQLAATHPSTSREAGYLRVRIWRRLQEFGAVAVKNAVHALPMNEETQENFERLLREIVEGGREAVVCEARLIDGLSIEEVRAVRPGS